MMTDTIVRDVLRFWFDEVGPKGWFSGGAALDAAISARFMAAHAAVSQASEADLLDTAERSLAAIIVLDQFSRQMFRGRGRAFESDAAALRLAAAAVARGHDLSTPAERRIFFYLPYEHAEDLRSQDTSVRLIGALGDALFTDYAERHRAVIRQFGRFPHRNAAAGRLSTAAERAYLATPGAGF